MVTKKQIQVILNRWMRFFKFRILHANDSPHRIALGIALGLFLAWTPLYGFHILMALGLSILLRANKFAALTSVWVCNPFTIIPIYYPNYLLGRKLLRLFQVDTNAESSYNQIQQFFSQTSLYSNLAGLFQAKFWQNLFALLWYKSHELWIGSLIMAALVALAAYFVTCNLVIRYRKTHPHRRFLATS